MGVWAAEWEGRDGEGVDGLPGHRDVNRVRVTSKMDRDTEERPHHSQCAPRTLETSSLSCLCTG